MLTTLMQMGGGGSKPVLDKTELKGNYQVAVDISMADILAMARAEMGDLGVGATGGATGGASAAGGGAGSGTAAKEASDPGGGGATVYASVEKLGLKLEQRKAPVEQIIVDSAEKTPTEN